MHDKLNSAQEVDKIWPFEERLLVRVGRLPFDGQIIVLSTVNSRKVKYYENSFGTKLILTDVPWYFSTCPKAQSGLQSDLAPLSLESEGLDAMCS